MKLNITTLRNDFPALHRQVYGKPLVYLDSAATAQKPQAVIDAIDEMNAGINGNVHRAVHYLAIQATERYEQARETIRRFINAQKTQEIIFTAGTTAAINLVAFSFGERFVKKGDEIVITEAEHHSNIVPWQLLCERKEAKLKVLPVDDSGRLQIERLPELLTERTRIVAVTQASNVLGIVYPIREIIQIAHSKGEMQYITSIGCPYGCRFCAVSMPFQPRPMQRIDNELSQLHEATGFTEVSFADPNIAHFAYTAESGKNIRFDAVTRMRALGAVMRKLDASWECNMRCPDLTPDMVDAMAHGKCTHMELGCESGSERVLRDIVRKGHGVEAIRQAVKSVKGSGISTMYSFLAFMPGETMQDIIETMDLIDWIVDADPLARVSIYQFTPYPGTPLYQDAVSGKHGYPPFSPPKTMMEWGRMRLMASPIYWIAGLNFRLDNSRKNFPGDDWRLIEPYIKQAQIQWRNREILDFPVEEVEQLISAQLAKRQKNRCV